MPRMSKDQIVSLKEEYKNGIKPSELLSKYNITKHALYHHVGKGKSQETIKPVAPDATLKSSKDFLPQKKDVNVFYSDNVSDVDVVDANMRNFASVEDPLIDFDQIEDRQSNRNRQLTITDEDIFNITRDPNEDMDFDLFHPNNLLNDIAEKPISEKPKKWNTSIFTKGKLGEDDKKKSPEELKKELEQERLRLVFQIRLYLYTFREQNGLFASLNIDKTDDKKINKFVQDLYKRRVPDLKKLLDFVKFQVRNDNHICTGNFISNVFFTLIKVFEMIITRFGVDITGLCDDLKNDKEIINNMKEIEIEMTANKMNLGPKTDILLKLCTRGLAKFSENKVMNKMKEIQNKDFGKDAMDKLNTKPINENLKDKYSDI